MYSKIIVPVDLRHTDTLAKSIDTAADLSKLYGIQVVFVGVTAATPGDLGHNPAEYAKKLEAFGKVQAGTHGIDVATRAITSHDPTTDLDDAILAAVHEAGADLVVMASHIPGLADYIWPSNGGKIAAHSDASVFVVR